MGSADGEWEGEGWSRRVEGVGLVATTGLAGLEGWPGGLGGGGRGGHLAAADDGAEGTEHLARRRLGRGVGDAGGQPAALRVAGPLRQGGQDNKQINTYDNFWSTMQTKYIWGQVVSLVEPNPFQLSIGGGSNHFRETHFVASFDCKTHLIFFDGTRELGGKDGK